MLLAGPTTERIQNKITKQIQIQCKYNTNTMSPQIKEQSNKCILLSCCWLVVRPQGDYKTKYIANTNTKAFTKAETNTMQKPHKYNSIMSQNKTTIKQIYKFGMQTAELSLVGGGTAGRV